ncbi:MAG: hypothetical protein CSA44_01830 [Gammaproteobacteria bacterium]|nr:MAG: hypothetical protein CSA44_01830 [Gammaproteobacteria bacterium]
MGLLTLVRGVDSYSIDTDFNHILPQAENTNVRQALTTINNRQNRQLLVAVRLTTTPDKQTLNRIAGVFSNQLFILPNQQPNDKIMTKWYQQLLPYRHQLLSQQDRNDLKNHRESTVIKRAQRQLYGFAGINQSQFINDPLFLFQRFFIQTLPQISDVRFQGNWVVGKYAGQIVAILPLALTQSAFDIHYQQQVKQTIAEAQHTAEQHNGKLTAVGAIVFAEQGFSQSKREISSVGFGGILGIVLLLLYAFRSLRPLLLLISALGLSLALSLQLTLLVFGSLHIVALLFSAAIVGISIDYGFHFLTDYYQHNDDAKTSIKRIFPGLTLGLCSSVLAYTLFAFSGLQLLKQVAALAIFGLPSMYLTVVLVLPYFYHSSASNQWHIPKVLQTIAQWLVNNPLAKLFSRPILLIGALSVLLIDGFTIKPNDDVRNLQAMSTQLLADERLIRSVFNKPYIDRYALLSGDDSLQLLQAEKTLTRRYPNIFPPQEAISTVLPDTAQQLENRRFYQQLYQHKLSQAYQAATGYVGNLAISHFKPLPIAELLHSPAMQQRFSNRLLVMKNNRLAIMLPIVSKNFDADVCASIAGINNVSCHLLSPVNDLSAQFARYRQQLSYYLLLAGVILLLLSLWRYGKRGLFVALLPLFCAALSVVMSNAFGMPLSLFSILAALLVLGMGLDYVIFLAETDRPARVMVSLALSYLTTLLSFGLLAVSQTVAVSTFGLTTAIGMTAILVLSPMVKKDEHATR